MNIRWFGFLQTQRPFPCHNALRRSFDVEDRAATGEQRGALADRQFSDLYLVAS